MGQAPAGRGKSALKHFLSLNGLDLLKTGALCQLGQVRAKGGMCWLPTCEFKLPIIPDDMHEIAWRSRRSGGERIQVHQQRAIAVKYDHLLLRSDHG
jgi:hypothetical protein